MRYRGSWWFFPALGKSRRYFFQGLEMLGVLFKFSVVAQCPAGFDLCKFLPKMRLRRKGGARRCRKYCPSQNIARG